MAYLLNDEEEKQPGQEVSAPQSTISEGNVPGGSAAPTPLAPKAPGKQGSGMFTDLSSYVKGNQPAIQNLGNSVTNAVTNAQTDATTAQAGAKTFQDQVKKGTNIFNPAAAQAVTADPEHYAPLISPYGKSLGGGAEKTRDDKLWGGMKSLYEGTSAQANADEAANVSDFKKGSAGYTGPTSYDATEADTAQARANDVARQSQTLAGVQDMVAQKAPKANAAFDTDLLRQSGGLSQINDAAGATQAASTQWGTLRDSLPGQVQAAQTQSGATQAGYLGAASAAQTKQAETANAAAGPRNAAKNAAYEKAKAGLESGDPTEQDLATLGLTWDQYLQIGNAGLKYDDYLGKSTDGGAQYSPEELKRAEALARLSGQPTALKQGTGATPATFDFSTALTDAAPIIKQRESETNWKKASGGSFTGRPEFGDINAYHEATKKEGAGTELGQGEANRQAILNPFNVDASDKSMKDYMQSMGGMDEDVYNKMSDAEVQEWLMLEKKRDGSAPSFGAKMLKKYGSATQDAAQKKSDEAFLTAYSKRGR